MYLVCLVLQQFLDVPFVVIALGALVLIWLYTRRGGMKTLVWTDVLQTLCLLAALVLILMHAVAQLDMNVGEAWTAVWNDPHTRFFEFGDWQSRQYFWKQFLSGMFLVIVMTGLDQDMMQKNLTCKSLREAQKDMCSYGFAFVPANLLFLALGVLLVNYAGIQGAALPEAGDDLLPMFAATGQLGQTVVVLFTIGIVAAAFSSADSALTALTTSCCVDIVKRPDDERLRKRVHILMAVLFVAFVMFFRWVDSPSVIDAIYTMCSYTYGPLLGLFAFSLFTKRPVADRIVPFMAVASPLVCFAADVLTKTYTNYRFGYELLMLNGALTFVGLYLSGMKNKRES